MVARGWVIAGLILAAVPAVIFPGDAPFVNDEPLLLMAALEANKAHTLALHGLMGNKGVAYGPLPTWIYQLLLVVTHDPVILTVIHAILLAAGTVLALFWLARVTRLWPPFAVVIALSPYVWFYDRQLWDNSFNIPICALVLAAYADFLARRSRAALAVAVVGLATAPLIHFMSLAFVAPVALHMLIVERRALLRHAWLVLPVPALLVALSWSYWRDVVGRVASGGAMHASAGLKGFVFPLLGGRYLSALGFHPVGGGWLESPPLVAARIVSALAYPLVWAGMALAAWRVANVIRRRTPDVVDHVAVIALAIVVAQALLDGFTKSFGYTHYFNATWIAYAALAWLAADALARAASRTWRALAWLVPLHGAALAIFDVTLVAFIHSAPGTHYGPTIQNQDEVAREIVRYPSGTPRVIRDLPLYRDYPHALTAMIALQGPTQPTASARQLVIQRRSADDGRAVVVAE